MKAYLRRFAKKLCSHLPSYRNLDHQVVATADANQLLAEVLQAHGLLCQDVDGWLSACGSFPMVRAIWTGRETGGRLDIHVLLNSETYLEESFAGSGAGVSGLQNGMQNFMVNSLHVVLAGLWGVVDDQQVLVEEWCVGQKTYAAYIGNFGRRASVGTNEPALPASLFKVIEANLRREPLEYDSHWCRLFFCNFNGDFTFEALLDNGPWEAGLAALKSLPWEKREGYYSVRNFVLLRDKTSEVQSNDAERGAKSEL
jgi:hypothetical protein